FTTDGAVDPTFGSGGIVTTPIGDLSTSHVVTRESGRRREVVGDLMPLLGHSPSIPLIANADKGPSVRVGSGAGGRHSRRLLEAEERTDVSHGTPARRTAFTVLS